MTAAMIAAPLHDSFLVHQARVLAQLDQGEVLLRTGGAEVVAALGRGRWALTRLLREYQIFKHSRIFDPAIRGADPAFAAAARDMKVSCIAAGDRFTAYVRHWSGQSVGDSWAEYQPAALAMIASLRGHLEQERQAVSRHLR